jgi:hypothetical protein
LFSTRCLAAGAVLVEGLSQIRSIMGWGSDGPQTVEVYGARISGSEMRYACEIREV